MFRGVEKYNILYNHVNTVDQDFNNLNSIIINNEPSTNEEINTVEFDHGRTLGFKDINESYFASRIASVLRFQLRQTTYINRCFFGIWHICVVTCQRGVTQRRCL